MTRFLPLLLVPLLFGSPLRAQSTGSEPPSIPRFTLTACAVGFDQTPELFWLDLEIDPYGEERREYRPLDIGDDLRGTPARIPVRPPLHLYRRQTDAEGRPRWVPALDIPEAEEGDRLLYLLYRSSEGNPAMRFLDESPEAHPAKTVRVANLSDQPMAVTIGGPPVPVPGQTVKLAGTPAFKPGGRFQFTYGITLRNSSFTSPTKNLRFRTERDRLLILYTLI